MRMPIESSLSLRALPPGRSLILTAMATLLAAADWLPDNSHVDPDHLEFALTIALGVIAIAVSVRDRITSDAILRWRNRAVAAVISMTIALATLEAATRWIFREVTTSSDNGGYFSRRWLRTGAVHLNGFGFREREFTAAKAPGTYRIAIVGDSFTFGNGLRQQDRFSDLLRGMLTPRFEVLNFGVAGANTPEHGRLIARLLQDIRPDFVLLQWYINDTEDDDTGGRPTFKPLVPFRPLADWLSASSALYAVVNMQWAETQVAFGMTQSYTDYLYRRLGDPNSHDSQLDRHLLLDLIAQCRKFGVPIGIVLFPDTAADLGQQYPFAYLHERVLDVCRMQGSTCLDLRNDFSLVKDRRSLWANRLDHHPSALANSVAAVRIFETYSGVWAASPK
jgi:hypothetical protein